MLKTFLICDIMIYNHIFNYCVIGGRLMDCALWLNRRKIFTAAEISGNLDVASLRGYFLAGTLIEWLDEHGGKRYAKKLSKLSPNDKMLNEKITRIFGAEPVLFKELKGETAPQVSDTSDISASSLLASYPIGSAGSYNYEAISSFGSFQNILTESSYSISSYLYGSLSGSGGSYSIEWEQWLSQLFGYGSFSMGSFSFGSFGSFSQWEWLFELLYGYGSFSAGSFTFGSFLSGSFSQWEWEWLLKLLYGYGSFSMGSFTFGSFSVESLLRLFKGYGSFVFGASGSFGTGSGGFANPNTGFFLDEYDLIMLRTLANCPLDRFGYGIHNI